MTSGSQTNHSSTPVSGMAVEALRVDAGRDVLLRDISFSVEPGEWISIIGPNGAGKSTLLRALAGLANRASGLRQPAGNVSLDGADITKLSHRERSKRIAWVPQNPTIPAGISVADYILLGRTPHLGLLATESKQDIELAELILADLDLIDLSGRSMQTLSGGEQQRAVIGRALAQEADIILLDEPTSALDLGHQQELLTLLARLRRDSGRTIISTMHDLTLAGQAADRLILLADGEIVIDGPPAEVLTEQHLQTVYGAALTVLDHRGAIVVVPSPHLADPAVPNPALPTTSPSDMKKDQHDH